MNKQLINKPWFKTWFKLWTSQRRSRIQCLHEWEDESVWTSEVIICKKCKETKYIN